MIRIISFKIIISLILLLIISNQVYAKDCVILLHGLAKTDRDMKKLEAFLTAENFDTVNFNYNSRTESIEILSKKVIEPALQKCQTFRKVHFVTHSMGGILVRHYLKNNKIDKLGRVVMLGPPNQGSEAVDSYRDFPGFKIIVGPAGLQLGTGKMSVPKKLGDVDFDLGVIAGSRSVNLLLSSIILPGKDDGKVTVESTKVVGMNDHITMPVTHPFMMKNNKVIKQVIYFLKNGKFYHQPEQTAKNRR